MIVGSEKATLDEISLRLCVIEEKIQSFIPQLRQHSVYLLIQLVGIGIFLHIHAVEVCLHLALKQMKPFFLQVGWRLISSKSLI